MVAAVALFIIFIGGSVAYWTLSGSIEKNLDEAIAKGHLINPPGDNAFDLYQQLKRKGGGGEKLARFNEKLLPLLTVGPQQILAGLADPSYKDPTPAEWEEAQKLVTWASEINPNDGALAAKATYCAGRVAFLRGRKDEALELWKRASEQDRSWAMPANGVGLIYNERKDYASARQFLYEAIRREPAWALPYNNLGTSFFNERNDDKAEYYYRQAIERAPQWARPHVWIGDIAMRRKDFCRAIQEYEGGLELDATAASGLDIERINQQLEAAKRGCTQSATNSSSSLSPVVIKTYNVDDLATIFVNGEQILQLRYGASRQMDITHKLHAGENQIRLVVENFASGYTYGFEIYRDQQSIFRQECGKVGVSGCGGQDFRTGTVYDHTLSVTVGPKQF